MGRSQHAIIVATILAVAMTACGPKGGGGRQGPPPLAVDVAQAQRSDIATYLSLDGQIAPRQESTVSTQQSGTVAAVYVTEGQRVSQGQLLAKLDDSTLRAQLAQAQGQAAQAAANVSGQTLQNPITAQQMSSAVTTAQQQLQQARNSLTSAQAAEANAKLVYSSNQQLLAQGYVSQTQFEQARSQYVAAQQSAANARNAVISAEAALQTARRNTGQTGVQREQIAAAQGALQQAQGQVRLLQTQIAQTSITAPFAGVVTARLLDPGAFAGPQAPVARVSQIDTVYVNVNVPDEDLRYVHKGTPVAFTTSSAPGKQFRGAVFDVNATPTQGTLSYRARIVQANPENLLRGGMLVTASVRKEEHRGAIVVPRTAVFQTENGANVFTVVDPPQPPPGAPGAGGAPRAGGGPGGGPPVTIKQAKMIPVQVGLQTDTLAEVRSPDVRPGTTIITTRPDALQDKSIVAMGPPAGAARKRANGASAQ